SRRATNSWPPVDLVLCPCPGSFARFVERILAFGDDVLEPKFLGDTNHVCWWRFNVFGQTNRSSVNILKDSTKHFPPKIERDLYHTSTTINENIECVED